MLVSSITRFNTLSAKGNSTNGLVVNLPPQNTEGLSSSAFGGERSIEAQTSGKNFFHMLADRFLGKCCKPKKIETVNLDLRA